LTNRLFLPFGKAKKLNKAMNLINLSEKDFNDYLENAISAYAEDKTKAGNFSAEKALELSRKGHEKLLPDGVNTKNNHLFSIFDEENENKVGIIWIKLRSENGIREIWLYDFLIFEQYRRKGFGKKSLELLEEKAKELGFDKISLHVFGHNQAAISLYQKMGFQTTNINMSKIINGNAGLSR
jgi:ribosomal protein S18 acetylase RimI-like enzyme